MTDPTMALPFTPTTTRPEIAPYPDKAHEAGVWQTARRFETRIAAHRELAALAGQPVIAPSDKEFYPAIASLHWREQHLNARY